MTMPKPWYVFILLISALASNSDASAGEVIVARSPAGYFEFHIDPWISLHHFAYHLVRGEQRELKLRGYVRITDEDKAALTPGFRSTCASLRTAYRPYIERSLLFDEQTRRIARELWHGPDKLTDRAVRDALTECMPVYMASIWPSHRQVSQAFLDSLIARLETHEARMASSLAKALNSSWPETPIRVDITPYVIWAGAYTDDFPPNITLSSIDDTIAHYAFEIVFHESAHTGAFSTSLETAAHAALQEAAIENDRFWHYILFFVTGRTVSEVLDDPGYVTYSQATGLTERRSARAYYEALDQSWDMDGSFQERVSRAAKIVASTIPDSDREADRD